MDCFRAQGIAIEFNGHNVLLKIESIKKYVNIERSRFNENLNDSVSRIEFLLAFFRKLGISDRYESWNDVYGRRQRENQIRPKKTEEE